MYTNKQLICSFMERPNGEQYVNNIFDGFIRLCGDRISGEDPSILGGLGWLGHMPVTVIAQNRGRTLSEQIKYNFSMSLPEGFRKSVRLMKQAEKFNRPIVCFIDTIGAYPGRAAEERGQAYAIANNLKEMMFLKTPIVTVIVGNGGSGGALALCIADRISILEHATLGVISPKACAEILWKDTSRESEAVEVLKMSSSHLLRQKIVDNVILEPENGAHSDVLEMSLRIKQFLFKELCFLSQIDTSKLVDLRVKKFKNMGIMNSNT